MTRPPPQQRVNSLVLVFVSAVSLLCFYITDIINKLADQPR